MEAGKRHLDHLPVEEMGVKGLLPRLFQIATNVRMGPMTEKTAKGLHNARGGSTLVTKAGVLEDALG